MKHSISLFLVAGLAVTSLIGAVSLASTTAEAAVSTATTSASLSAGVPSPLTNLAHLDFLLDTASPGAIDGHTTYRLADEPAITMPWTYADSRPGGAFARVGGGPLDTATGHYGQGAYNADDITRAAVVYLRDWKQTGAQASRTKAYELLRSVAFFQTSSGPNAGNVVLWMQSDGSFNPSPVPVEQPDPSDSGASYWLARSLWAFGEGYAGFKDTDPAFASFLQQRLQLGVAALNREVLDKYGSYAIADGTSVPAWLIINGADASAEAVLGLSAYSAAVPADATSRTALAQLAEGISKMGAGSLTQWPYGAILPWAESRSMWHAYASQMPAALAAASVVLKKPALLEPAAADSVGFTTELLTAGGPDNGWYPTPVDTTQIAYGADSRLQSLLAVSAAGSRPGIRDLACIAGSWFFGANPSGKPTYDPATGVTFDGVQSNGTVNPNSGAESTIHGLLSMLALDANPDVAARAVATPVTVSHDGLTVVQAESATATTGTVVTPDSAWTGESQFGAVTGGAGSYLSLPTGTTASLAIPAGSGARHLEPVTFQPNPGSASSVWSADGRSAGRVPLGSIRDGVGAQGITAVPGVLLPQTLPLPIGAGAMTVTVRATSGTVQLDAVIVRPLVSRLLLRGASASTELVHSTSVLPLPTTLGAAGEGATVHNYDAAGRLVKSRTFTGIATIVLQPGGFAVVTR